MDIEVFSYSVLTSILGILIVFLSLCALSLLMVGLKVAFAERPEKDVFRDEAESPVLSEINNRQWVVAAVAAFLAMEESEMRVPSAEVWTPGISESSDSWMNRWTGTKKDRMRRWS